MLQKYQDKPEALTTAFIRFGGIIFLLFIATFFLPGCKDNPPVLTGTAETFTTNGNADDGDDQATPPPGGVRYTNPARTASDGLAKAVSDPQSYRSLRGSVVAQLGPQASRFSSAQSLNSVLSTFVVQKLLH